MVLFDSKQKIEICSGVYAVKLVIVLLSPGFNCSSTQSSNESILNKAAAQRACGGQTQRKEAFIVGARYPT